MKVYLVGGAVRDELLGLPIGEKDYVVVGSTPEEMAAKGFKPVGKDFPVFLHPSTHEEYALARTERKSGRGYKGFTVFASPEVTLEEDLRRRDLTINAIAKDEAGRITDPFDGRGDIERRVLRHVSESFVEDPVRILRVARFAARFGFKVADETMALMKKMVRSGETDFLVPERVWQEFSKGLAEKHPQRLFDVLETAGLRKKLLPGVKHLRKLSGPLAVRFAQMACPLSESAARSLGERLRAPGDVRDLAILAAGLRKPLLGARRASPQALLRIFKRADAFRRPERFELLLQAVHQAEPKVDVRGLQRTLKKAAAVDAGKIAAGAASPSEIPKKIEQARLAAIRG